MEKRELAVHKVVCRGCGKTRLWDDRAQCPVNCWQCQGVNEISETTVVEVK